MENPPPESPEAPAVSPSPDFNPDYEEDFADEGNEWCEEELEPNMFLSNSEADLDKLDDDAMMAEYNAAKVYA